MNLKMFCANNSLRIINDAGKEALQVGETHVIRCGLQLTGFYEHFNSEHICVLGKAEVAYLLSLGQEAAAASLKALVAKKIPAIILADDIKDYPPLTEICKRHRCILLAASSDSVSLVFKLSSYLSHENAPWIGLHGVMMEVYGVGVLIRGISGIGKSEVALELIKRGGRFVADDLVKIVRTSDGTLICSGMKEGSYYMEIRGLGIIDVKVLFGVSSIRIRKDLDLIVDLVPWNADTKYDRLGDKTAYDTLMDCKIPVYQIPVSVGRNLAVLIETAAIRTRAAFMGYDFMEDFLSQFD